jgi:hypothetical protein
MIGNATSGADTASDTASAASPRALSSNLSARPHRPGHRWIDYWHWICGVVGRATACVCGDAGSIPTGGALKVWQWANTAWLVNKSAGQTPILDSVSSGTAFQPRPGRLPVLDK